MKTTTKTTGHATEARHTVPLVDRPETAPVYHPMMLRLALLGTVAGAILFGLLAWLVTAGPLALPNLGPLASAGPSAAAYAAAGIGAAAGGFAGGWMALRRMEKYARFSVRR